MGVLPGFDKVFPDPKLGLIRDTLREARELFWKEARNGTHCAICRRRGKIDKIKLNATLARTLIYFHRWDRGKRNQWIKPLEAWPYSLHANTYGKLEWWKLIEEKGEKKDDGNPHAGYYRITEYGRRFVLNETRIYKNVFIFDNEPRDVEEEGSREMTSIVEALGDAFNYTELMEA